MAGANEMAGAKRERNWHTAGFHETHIGAHQKRPITVSKETYYSVKRDL